MLEQQNSALSEPEEAVPATEDAGKTPSVDGSIPHANSPFQQPWWLDAVAPGAWDAVEVRRDNEVIGRWPFSIKRRMGMTVLSQPPLTPYLGPWIREGAGKYNAKLAHEHDVLHELAAALPDHDIFAQNFHPSMTNCLALHWSGFRQRTNYTYGIDDLVDLDRIWSDLDGNVRTNIRKAGRKVAVETSDDIETMIRLHRMTYARQGTVPPHTDDTIRRLDAACRAHDAGQIFLAKDSDGAVHAADYVVWDDACGYGLMSGSDPEYRRSAAGDLIRWEVFKFASKTMGRFDCSGSMVEQIEPAIRRLGTRQKHYAHLWRGHSVRGRVALMASDLRGGRH